MKHPATTGLKGRAMVFSAGLLLTCLLSYSSMQAQGCIYFCKAPATVSVSAACQDTLTYEDVGVQVGEDCNGENEVVLYDNGVPIGNVITTGMVGKTYMVVVTNLESGQNCMFNITIVDQHPPLVVCPADTTLPCTANLTEYSGLALEDITECSGDVTITFNDVLIFPMECIGDTVSQYRRTYVITDQYNNFTTCEQVISLIKASLEDVIFPSNIMGDEALSCAPPPDLSPEATGYPRVGDGNILNGQFCNLSAIYQDTELPLCGASYKIMRIWTVFDMCAGNISVTDTQFIEVIDDTPPVVTAPADITVSTGASSCSATVNLPPAQVTDDCSPQWNVRTDGPFGTINANGGVVTGLEPGVHVITYTATDACLLSGSDFMTVTVEDLQPPGPVCHTHLAIPLNHEGIAAVPAYVFDAGSTDNCSDVYFKVKRMSLPQGYTCANPGNPNNLFDDFIQFCCEDIANNNIMVVFRVYDQPVVPGPVSDDYLTGHFNDCMVEVQVQDKLPAEIICPSDITVSCQFPWTIENLNVFGKVALSPETREEICLDDPGIPGDPGIQCIGLDGLAYDNCHVEVTELAPVINIGKCGTGTIVRTFNALDDGGVVVSCQQTITIVNYEPFGEGDFVWPEHYTTYDICDVSLLSPEHLPPPYNAPVVNYVPCSQVGINYTDEVFDFSHLDEACFKILRTWRIADDCQLNGSTESIWTFHQTIKVINTTAPVIEPIQNVTICSYEQDCGGLSIDFSASASDDCSGPASLLWRYFIDLDNNQDFDYISAATSGGSVTFSWDMPVGTHRILYTVSDRCGNSDVVEQLVTVESCVLPNPLCHHGLSAALMPMDTDGDGEPDWGMVTVLARMFDAGSAHPCGNAITVSFSPDLEDTVRVFDCSHLGSNPLEIWVMDENGLSDFCTTYIEITDNHSICPPSDGITQGTIAGRITVPQSGSLANAMVYLEGTEVSPIPTAENGQFVFPAIPLGSSFKIRPEKGGDDRNGINVLDLLKIQKHLLGIEAFNDPFAFIAADANNSKGITAMDIVLLRRLVLGIDLKLSHNTSWRFIDKAHVFPDPANPWTTTWAESYTIDPLMSSMYDIDFHAVKIGDIDRTANLKFQSQPILPRTDKSAVLEYVVQAEEQQPGLYRVDLYLQDARSFEALQLSFTWDYIGYKLKDWSPGDGFNADAFRIPEENHGNISFAGYEPGGWANDRTHIMTMWMEAASAQVRPLSMFLNAEPTIPVAFTVENNDPASVQIISGKSTIEVKAHNWPNPFADMTTIFMKSMVSEDAELRIYDMNGRLKVMRPLRLIEGENEFIVSKTELHIPGVYIYEIESGTQWSTNRMIILE